MKKGNKIFAVVFSLIGVSIIGSASYILTSYFDRRNNDLFDAIEIKDVDRVISSECDLGILNPGESKTQTIEVRSLLSVSASYTMSLKSNSLTEGLSKYFHVGIAVGEEDNSYPMDTALQSGDLVKRKLLPKEKDEIVFSYSLADDVPEEYIGNTFGFEISLKANATL